MFFVANQTTLTLIRHPVTYLNAGGRVGDTLRGVATCDKSMSNLTLKMSSR